MFYNRDVSKLLALLMYRERNFSEEKTLHKESYLKFKFISDDKADKIVESLIYKIRLTQEFYNRKLFKFVVSK